MWDKLRGDETINKGLSSLRKLKEKIDYDKEKEPFFLAVITGVNSSYKLIKLKMEYMFFQ